MRKVKILKMLLTTTILVFTLVGCVRTNSTTYNYSSSQTSTLVDDEETTEIDTAPEVVDSKDLSMTINYGYEKHAKYGRNMQVTIDITNTGKDFLGKIQVIVPNESLGNVMYEKEVAVATDSTKKVSLAIPLNSYADKFEFKLVNEQNKVISSKSSRVNVLINTNTIFAGVLSDDYNSLSYMNSDILYTFNLTEETLSEDVLGLDLLDIIIINDFNTSKLNEAQYNAIKSWVNAGGTLVIGTGGSYKKTMEVFSDDFITGKIGNTSQKDFTILGQVTIEKEILDITIDDATTILKNKYPLIEQVKSGKGVINIMTFDLGLNSSDWKVLGNDIREAMINSISPYKNNQLETEAMGYRGSNWNLYNILSDISMGELPNISLIGILLVIYTLIAGPILYIVLKKMDKRNLMWVSLPVIAIGFSVVILLVGNRTRFTQPFINYLSITTINGKMADDKVYFSVMAPYNKKYSMEFNNKYGVQVMNQNAYYYGGYGQEVSAKDYKVAMKYKADTTTIELKDFTAFSSNYFNLTDYHEEAGSMDSDIIYTRKGVIGSIKNNLGYDLENAALISNGMVLSLGTIKDGETFNIDGNSGNLIPISRDYNSIVNTITGTDLFDQNTTSEEMKYANQKNSTLSYYFIKYLEEDNKDTYIVGFNKETKESNFTKDFKYDSAGITLCAITTDINYQNENQIYLPNINVLISNTYEGYDVYGNFYGETAILDYNLDDNSNILELFYEPYGGTFNNYQYFYGNIEFYNYYTQDYEIVFDDTDTITDLDKYMGEKNILRARYTKALNTSGYYDSMTLPVISAVKEAK